MCRVSSVLQLNSTKMTHTKCLKRAVVSIWRSSSWGSV